jgi:hypothetical protein
VVWVTVDHDLDVFGLLDRLGRQRFVIHQFRGDGVDTVAAVHHWGEVADVLILVDEYHACAYRTPTGRDAEDNEIDVFDPGLVYWWFTANPEFTIARLLELPQPAHRDAPSQLVYSPMLYRLPKEARREARVRMRPRHGT